jgi:membrane protein implicated in regulation of membrane protease activity
LDFQNEPEDQSRPFLSTSEDISDFLHGDKETVISLIQQSLAMCLAAFAYGDLHLLAWHAPFHAPIYGLLWKTSGFTIAGLGVLPLLAVSIFFGIRFASPGDKKRRVSRSLGLA